MRTFRIRMNFPKIRPISSLNLAIKSTTQKTWFFENSLSFRWNQIFSLGFLLLLVKMHRAQRFGQKIFNKSLQNFRHRAIFSKKSIFMKNSKLLYVFIPVDTNRHHLRISCTHIALQNPPF